MLTRSLRKLNCWRGAIFSENPAESSKPPVQSTLESDADSSTATALQAPALTAAAVESRIGVCFCDAGPWPLLSAGVGVDSRFFASNHVLVFIMLSCFLSVHDSFGLRAQALLICYRR